MTGVDSHRRSRRLLWRPRPATGRGAGDRFREWAKFEPLIGHTGSALTRRPVRADPQAQARPDRRPAGGRLQRGGERDPRPGARRPGAGGRRLRGAGRGPGHAGCSAPGPTRDRAGAGQDAGRRRGGRHRRAAAAAPPAGARPAAARSAGQGADADGLQPDQRGRPDGHGLHRGPGRPPRSRPRWPRWPARRACSPRR